ncbi:protein-glutamine gamma-glutamyltransferase E-like [Hyla sarda]|uniref:protein-glutamine gamma-glutamyltransferase E-like n=1 Tax=Hyla sarda TaxID=327740 RepID=UPI0024C3837B|nr:protein-glutamine gamma-glutamyltransferase E-like [Hyla sarda]
MKVHVHVYEGYCDRSHIILSCGSQKEVCSQFYGLREAEINSALYRNHLQDSCLKAHKYSVYMEHMCNSCYQNKNPEMTWRPYLSIYVFLCQSSLMWLFHSETGKSQIFALLYNLYLLQVFWDIMAENTTTECTYPCINDKLAGEFKLVSANAIGKDVVLHLSITNLTTDPKIVNADIRACSVLYTKKEINELLKERKRLCLEACEETKVPVVITYAQYEDLLTPDNSIEVTAACSCEPFEGTIIVQTNVVLDNPKFEIKLKKIAWVNKPVDVEIIFTNPLAKEISDIVVTAEGSGLLHNPVTVKGNPVKPNETIQIPLTITPYKTGKKHLLVDLTCNKFQNAKGYLEIEVHGTE